LHPPIPEKLCRIDDSTIGEHFSLDADDRCYYIWEYTAGRRYDFSPTNQLIINLKIKPGAIERTPARGRYKEQAIAHAANALRRLIRREFVETRSTFVPIPCSKAQGHADHDDRLPRVLRQAFHEWGADIREMLSLTQSTAADHESTDRLSFEELLRITRLSEPNPIAPRPVIILVDDVLNSGKHFKVAQSLIRSEYPDIEIRGLFLARCVREWAESDSPSDGQTNS
jgi:hypothetical protein